MATVDSDPPTVVELQLVKLGANHNPGKLSGVKVVVPSGVAFKVITAGILGAIRLWTGLDPTDWQKKGNLCVSSHGTDVLCHDREVSVNVGDEHWRQGIRLAPAKPQLARSFGLQFVD